MGFSAGAAISINGHRMDEVISTIQKGIRRSNEKQAHYWVREAVLSGYGNWAWKRLQVICLEDVGLGEPHLFSTIRNLYEFWKELDKAKSADSSLPICMAVTLLVRASKSRLICDQACVFYDFNQAAVEEFMGGPVQVPDHALDMHTQQGRRMKRGNGHFYEEGGRLEREVVEHRDNEYDAFARPRYLAQDKPAEE